MISSSHIFCEGLKQADMQFKQGSLYRAEKLGMFMTELKTSKHHNVE